MLEQATPPIIISERSCLACEGGNHDLCWRYQAYLAVDETLGACFTRREAAMPSGFPWCSCYEYRQNLHPQHFYE